MGKVEAYNIREYQFIVEGVAFKIRGRILIPIIDEGKKSYIWEVSHYYKEKGAAEYYMPGQSVVESLERAEQLMVYYMKGFSGDFIPNNAFSRETN